jgi:hypothetical protein
VEGSTNELWRCTGTTGVPSATGAGKAPTWERRLSNPPPPPESPGPDDTPSPAEQVSGQPWSTPSGNPLSGDPLAAGAPAADPASGDRYQPADPASGDRYQPAEPPAQPTFRPGYAALPRPPEPQPPYGTQPPYGPPYGTQPPYGTPYGTEYPPTAPFAAPAGNPPLGYGSPYPGDPATYPPGGYGPPGYGAPPPYGPPRRRRSNVPLVALILAVAVLLCGGGVTATVMVARAVADRAKEAVKPITEPTLPQFPTEAPNLPGLPTDVPTLPTDLPGLPGTTERTITVTYEVTGDGPAEIGYVEKPGDTPKRITDAKLPWRVTTTMQSPAFVLVTAIRGDTDAGSISCRASVDGEQVAQSSRDGAFATVACSKFVLE